MKAFPPVTADLKQWAQSLVRSLQSGWSMLDYQNADSRASEDGVILWDATGGNVAVSRGGAWRSVSSRTTAPATASSTGTAGDWAYDSGYIYICTATNTWKRVAVATW